MSVVVGIRYADLVVIATDTRLVDTSSGTRRVVSDDFRKLKLGRFGWIAGVGHHDTVQGAVQNLESADIHQAGDVQKALDDAWATILEPAKARFPQYAAALDHTHLMMSMEGNGGLVAFCYSPATYGSSLQLLPIAALSILGPSDVGRTELQQVRQEHGPADAQAAVRDRVLSAVVTAAAVVHDVAQRSADVSGTADIGLHRSASQGFRRYLGPASEIAQCEDVTSIDRFDVPHE